MILHPSTKTLSGIYIHIPFCKQKCSYCDFHFSTNLKLQDDLVDALCKEIELQKEYLKAVPQTLYFGGGSPSILSQPNLGRIFESLHTNFDLGQLQEVTLESNPDDHNAKQLQFWKSLGINRLSIGIQSFIDRDLALMNRAHDSAHAAQCVAMAREAGFEALTIDLIYGIPGQSMDEWKENVQRAIKLNTDHISAYCLTVEPKTALAHQVEKGIVIEKSDEAIETEYLHLHRTLEENGFFHYEISNYARPGKKAAHNSNYWSGKVYLGLGPSAHSFDGYRTRHWNVSNNARYIKAIKESASFYEEEVLTEQDRTNEMLMTGLRTREGVQMNGWNSQMREEVLTSIARLGEPLKSYVQLESQTIRIKPEHWLMADAVIRELVLV